MTFTGPVVLAVPEGAVQVALQGPFHSMPPVVCSTLPTPHCNLVELQVEQRPPLLLRGHLELLLELVSCNILPRPLYNLAAH